jgi:dethiobiotin synthetase
MKKSTIFITGTSTEVGKTYIAAKLIESLVKTNAKISVYKPIISGFEDAQQNDIKILLKAQNRPYTKENIENTALYIFKAPISPDIAARNIGITIDINKIKKFIKNTSDITIIEGAGGLMTPINAAQTNLDLIKALKKNLGAKAILITTNYLGMLSHTLSAIKALKAEKIEIDRLIINQTHQNELDVNELKKSLQNFFSGKIILLKLHESLAF